MRVAVVVKEEGGGEGGESRLVVEMAVAKGEVIDFLWWW